MRKALIGILMGAVLTTPMAAAAQNRDRQGRGEREADQTATAQPQSQRAERAMQRYERTAQRNAERYGNAEQRAAAQQQRAEAVQQTQAQARPQRDGNRGGYTRGQRPRQDQAVTEQVRTGTGGSDRNWRGQNGQSAAQRDYRSGNRYDGRNDNRNDSRYQNRNGRDGWNRSWRQDNRYDWQRYRASNRNIFRIGRYYSPYRNRGYSRFSIGLSLGSGYYGNRYWINDPWQYRLPPAYAGTRWIRYYDDVLLVDMYSGQVLDVIYNFFW